MLTGCNIELTGCNIELTAGCSNLHSHLHNYFLIQFVCAAIGITKYTLTNQRVHLMTFESHSKADPEQCCWGGCQNCWGGGGVRARRREAPSSKCDRGSAKRLPRELRQGSGGAKIGLLES